LDIPELLSVAQQHNIDAIHPGYGFLSESAEFSWKMWEAGISVIGPGWEILDKTGDKLKARMLAEECKLLAQPYRNSQMMLMEFRQGPSTSCAEVANK
jgi:pyruvate carboxylase